MPLLIIFLVLLVSFLILFLIVCIVMLAFDLLLDLPFVATDRKKIATIMKFANIKAGETVVDLGSGDGRLLLASALRGAKAIGYELNPLLISLSLIHAKLKGILNEVTVIRQSLWKADLKVADVIFVYSLKRDIKKFEDFVYQNAKKGTRIIVNTNPFPNKKPQKHENGIFLYVV